MRYLILIFIFSAVNSAVFSQSPTVEQPTEPFPFNLSLYKPDSTLVESTAIFSKKNNATLVAFWLTTCFPCANELDAYNSNYEIWKKEYGLEIVAVSMDLAERFRKIEERLVTKKYAFPVFWDRIRAFKTIMPGGLNGYPQVFLFDKNGQLVWRKKGYLQGDELKMLEEVKKLN